ncbi:MAG: CPBP family glutamic-type intramembrane protease [Promethearchaeota archaeon]|jgi:hypothetical protein
MRNFKIVEIENSFLNFFTPAVLVAISYFFLNLIGWPSLLLIEILSDIDVQEVISSLLNLLISMLYVIVTSGILYYLLIYLPRLKVHDTEFKNVSKKSMYITLLFFCLMVSFRFIFVKIYESIFGHLLIHPKLFFSLEEIRNNGFFLLLNLTYDSILYVLLNEIVYRRALIPMLEDRGLSPFHAVILTALGNSFIDIPGYVLNPNHPTNSYSFIIGIFLGLCAGLIYVITRNIIFPVLFSSFFASYSFLLVIITESQVIIYDSINLLAFLTSLVIILYLIFQAIAKNELPEITEFFRKRSSPNIAKGIVGFFIISLGLLGVQTIVAKIGRELFVTTPGDPFPGYFIFIMIFYAIAFSVPFFLTISTEWATDPAI